LTGVYLDMPDLADEGWTIGGSSRKAGVGPSKRWARRLFSALYRQLGAPGTLTEHADGDAFDLDPAFDGSAHSWHRILVPLPGGEVVSHEAAIALSSGDRWIVIDFVCQSEGRDRLKAAAFDALHLRQRASVEPYLVYVRGARPELTRADVEAIAYPYAMVYGVDEEDLESGDPFGGLRSTLFALLSS